MNKSGLLSHDFWVRLVAVRKGSVVGKIPRKVKLVPVGLRGATRSSPYSIYMFVVR
jgi:hypothetical protein